MSNSVNLSLDVTKTGIQNPLIKVRQGDGGFETLHTTVTSNGEPLDLQGWTITFMGTTAGNHKIVDANVTIVEAPNGIFDYTPSKAWGMDIGEFKIAYFKFVKGDGSASSANFRVNVIEAVDLTQEEAKDYISVVDATIAAAKQHLTDSLADVTASVATTSSAAGSLAVSVSNTASSAVNTINTTASSAVSQVNSAASSASSVASSAANNVLDVASNAVANVNGASNTYLKKSQQLPAVARDFNYLAMHMQTYQGTWWNGTDQVLNGPTSNWTWSVIEIVSGNSETTGIIRTTRFAAGNVYYANVSGGVIQKWTLIANDANVAHNTGTETIAGDKTFTGSVSANKLIVSQPTTTKMVVNHSSGLVFYFSRTTDGVVTVTTSTTKPTASVGPGWLTNVAPNGFKPNGNIDLPYLRMISAQFPFATFSSDGQVYLNNAISSSQAPGIVGTYITNDVWPV